MLFLCARCQARYKVSDEKVRGRVLKIRCKHCSALIVLRSPEAKKKARAEQVAETASVAQAAVAESGAVAKVAASGGASVPAPGNGAKGPARSASMGSLRIARPTHTVPTVDESGQQKIWHVAIGRQKKGPMTVSDVEALVADGSLSATSYVWRAGMRNWVHLQTIGDFETALANFAGTTEMSVLPERDERVPSADDTIVMKFDAQAADEAKAKAEAEAEAAAAAEAEAKAKAEAEAEAEAAAAAEAEAKAKAEAEAAAEAEAKAAAEAEAAAAAEAEAKAKAEAEAEAEAAATAEAEAKAKAEAEAKAAAEAEALAEAQAAEAEAKALAEAEAAEAAALAEAEAAEAAAAEALALAEAEAAEAEALAAAAEAEAAAAEATAAAEAAEAEAAAAEAEAAEAESQARAAEAEVAMASTGEVAAPPDLPDAEPTVQTARSEPDPDDVVTVRRMAPTPDDVVTVRRMAPGAEQEATVRDLPEDPDDVVTVRRMAPGVEDLLDAGDDESSEPTPEVRTASAVEPTPDPDGLELSEGDDDDITIRSDVPAGLQGIALDDDPTVQMAAPADFGSDDAAEPDEDAPTLNTKMPEDFLDDASDAEESSDDPDWSADTAEQHLLGNLADIDTEAIIHQTTGISVDGDDDDTIPGVSPEQLAAEAAAEEAAPPPVQDATILDFLSDIDAERQTAPEEEPAEDVVELLSDEDLVEAIEASPAVPAAAPPPPVPAKLTGESVKAVADEDLEQATDEPETVEIAPETGDEKESVAERAAAAAAEVRRTASAPPAAKPEPEPEPAAEAPAPDTPAPPSADESNVDSAEAFFAAGEAAAKQAAAAPVTDAELANLPGPEPAEEPKESFFPTDSGGGKVIPVLELPSPDAVRPSKHEVKNLIQEFSLMIRLNKRSNRAKFIAAGVTVVVIAALGAVGWYSQKKAAEEAAAKRARDAQIQLDTPEEEVVTYTVEERRAQIAAARKAKTPGASKTMREQIDLTGLTKENRPKARTNGKPRGKRPRTKVGSAGGAVEVEPEQWERKLTAAEIAERNRQKIGETTDTSGKREIAIGLTPPKPSKRATEDLSDAKISALIQRRSRKFMRCNQSGGSAKVKLSFTVAASGAVQKITVATPGLSDAALQSCVRAIVAKWRFPPIAKAKTFSKTLML